MLFREVTVEYSILAIVQLLSNLENFFMEFCVTTHELTDGGFDVLVIFLVTFHKLQVEKHSCKFPAWDVLSQFCDS